MELKVWVEGIQRVVCGVTIETTCQDVVIALAHAMGRTGRFTLVEKWRDMERPLAPTQCPVAVLHKWGEYAGDVRFLLYHSDKLFAKSKEKTQTQQTESKGDLPLRSLAPNKLPEGNIKRSLTFTGIHNSPILPPFKRERLKDSHQNVRVNDGGSLRNSRENLIEENSSSLPNASSSSNLHRSSPHLNIPAPLHGRTNAQPKSNFSSANQPSYKANIPNGHIPQAHTRQPMKIDRNNNDRVRAQSCDRRLPLQSDNRTRAVSCDRNLPSRVRSNQSPSPYIEEYDLDKHFRHGSYDSSDTSGRNSVNSMKGALRQTSGNNTLDKNKSEFTRLWRLISQQQERLKLQESQLTLLDTEIITTEEREKRLAEADRKLMLEIKQSESLHEQYNQELDQFDYDIIVSELDIEKENSKQTQADISNVKSKLSKCEKELVQLHQKIAQFMNSIKTGKSEIEEQKKLQKEMEEKLLKEIEDIKTEIDEKVKHSEKDVEELESLEKEINELESVISEKKKTIEELESELKDFNIKTLENERPLSPPTSPVQKSGEALLRFLEGKLTPRGGSARSFGKSPNTRNSIINENKGPGGVWV